MPKNTANLMAKTTASVSITNREMTMITNGEMTTAMNQPNHQNQPNQSANKNWYRNAYSDHFKPPKEKSRYGMRPTNKPWRSNNTHDEKPTGAHDEKPTNMHCTSGWSNSAADRQPRKPRTKYRWMAPDGNQIFGGGILFHDDHGVLLLSELNDEVKRGQNPTNAPRELLSDVGGKYEYSDGDIITTVFRELREETYYNKRFDMTFKEFEQALKHATEVYILDHKKETPVYKCYMIHVKYLPQVFDKPMCEFERCINEEIIESLHNILRCNPDVDAKAYRTRGFKYLSWLELGRCDQLLDSRLKAIIRESFEVPKG